MQITEYLNNLLEDIKRLDFPFLSSEHKKERIIQSKREEINNSIKLIIKTDPHAVQIDNVILDELWIHAKEITEPDFSNLSPKIKLHGFYFQQLMHNYVELIIKYIEKV